MLLHAAERFGIDLSRSWMIGDILHDVEAGNRAGCQTILLDVGNETEWVMNEYRYPTARVSSMSEAVSAILQKRDVYAA
jgi:FMN phosphatase YigB (HAD superfamily)